MTGRGILLAALLGFFVGAGAGPALAQEALTVTAAWARETIGQLNVGAAYVTVATTGAADRLLKLETDIAERAEVHEHGHASGAMRPAGALAIPAQGRIVFAPGGYHIMLIGLKQPLKQGERFPLRLSFEKAGMRTVDVVVTTIAAKGPPGS